jgi:hypothetical protein
MQEMKYEEIERRAIPAGLIDAMEKAKASARVHDVISRMREEGKALTLTEEEENMLCAFRRFKMRMRKQGEVFTWQTRKPEGVQLAEDTAEIVLPQEVAS